PAAKVDQVRVMLEQGANHRADVIRRVKIVVVEVNDNFASCLLDQAITFFANGQMRSIVMLVMNILVGKIDENFVYCRAVVENKPLDVRVILAAEMAKRLL